MCKNRFLCVVAADIYKDKFDGCDDWVKLKTTCHKSLDRKFQCINHDFLLIFD